MRILLLGLGLGLAGWALITAAGCLLALLLWRSLPPLRPGAAAASRAHGLFLAGVLPSALAAALVLVVVLPAFWLHEPDLADEKVGAALPLLALAGAGLLAGGAWRGWREARLTRELESRWMRSAAPFGARGLALPAHRFESTFPVASVVGHWRPRLFVSNRVLAGCDPEELDAILAHEAAHVAARDNLKRALLRAAPDPLAWTPLGRRLREEWSVAAEAAADEAAASGGPETRLALASALVRLARAAATPEPLAGAAVLDGSPVTSRVRRLLAEAPSAPPAPATLAGVLLASLLALLLLGVSRLEQVHAASEKLVALLG